MKVDKLWGVGFLCAVGALIALDVGMTSRAQAQSIAPAFSAEPANVACRPAARDIVNVDIREFSATVSLIVPSNGVVTVFVVPIGKWFVATSYSNQFPNQDFEMVENDAGVRTVKINSATLESNDLGAWPVGVRFAEGSGVELANTTVLKRALQFQMSGYLEDV